MKLVYVLFFSLIFLSCSGSTNSTPISKIAHAGGGFNGETYTDSLDALNFNKNSYTLFEMDFSFTSDNELVCIHDWGDYGSVKRTFGIELSRVPTLKEFENLVEEKKEYKNCTFSSLVEWLKANPNKKIITDVKDDNIKALEYIAKNFQGYKNQIIPQIYNPQEYDTVRKLGYKDIILTLYRWGGSDEQVLETAKENKYFAVTMPTIRAESLGPKLKSIGIPSYVHTINNKEDYEKYVKMGITSVYTDWLPAY